MFGKFFGCNSSVSLFLMEKLAFVIFTLVLFWFLQRQILKRKVYGKSGYVLVVVLRKVETFFFRFNEQNSLNDSFSNHAIRELLCLQHCQITEWILKYTLLKCHHPYLFDSHGCRVLLTCSHMSVTQIYGKSKYEALKTLFSSVCN